MTEISLEHAKAPREDPDLGATNEQDRDIEQRLGALLGGVQRRAKRAYKVEWEGTKVPRGMDAEWASCGCERQDDRHV